MATFFFALCVPLWHTNGVKTNPLPVAPPSTDKKTAHVNVRLTPELHAVLKRMAENEDRIVSYVMRRVLKETLIGKN